jgi:hypothetical protein
MALITHRINLDSATFPLLSELLGRTVIVRGSDQTHPQTFATQIASDPPQLYYAHNVLPTPYGYQSIGFNSFIPSTIYTDFVGVVTLRESATGLTALLGFTKSGKVLISTLTVPNWTEITLLDSAVIRGLSVTIAFVHGITYVYFYKLGCYKYDFTLGKLVPVVLNGLNTATVRGVVASNGYMLAFGDANAVAWSSILDPTDFVPNLATGAGAGLIEGAQGETVAAIAIQGGIIFLNGTNATSASYQSNGRYPFMFNTVVGCGGLSDPKFAANLSLDSIAAYAYTTSGLQAINTKQAEFITPEITEFLSGRRLEDFDEDTLSFVVSTPANVIKKRLAWVADRYLIVSYGDELLTHALVIDILLSRVGKLKIDHVAVFEFTLYDQTVFETPKKSIGILKTDGSVVVVDTDISAVNSRGVAVLGKYQYVRERRLQLQSVTVENIHGSGTFDLYDMITNDGKTLQAPVAGYDTGNAGLSKTYNFNSDGVNHSLLAKGRFNLVSGLLSFNIAGKR